MCCVCVCVYLVPIQKEMGKKIIDSTYVVGV